ncbi:MAG: ATP-dependent Clp protease ATP-binding subunit ClpX, partial [Phycisphaeraceae bacterium]
FVGLEDIIRQRLGQKAIGFNAEQTSGRKIKDDEAVLQHVTQDDVLHFGMIPELIGRLPVITPLERLTPKTLVSILTEPKNAVVRQYEYFFQMEGAELEFTEDALYALADRAIARDTGARALRSVMEDLMLDLMYDLPDENNKGVKYVIDASAVNEPRPLKELAQRVQKESA